MSARRARRYASLVLVLLIGGVQALTPGHVRAVNVTFTNHVVGPTPSSSAFVTHGDMDNDGDQDVLSANFSAAHVGVYLNDGAAQPSFTTTTVSTIDPTSVEVADVDDDGFLDIVANDRANGDIFWFENDGTPADGGWTSHTVTTSVPGVFTAFPADVNGDGDIDIVSTGHGDDLVTWHENDGTPTDGGWVTRTIFNWGGGNPHGVSAADLDGDGDVDVLAGAQFDNTFRWFDNDGADPPAWTPRVISTTSAFPAFVMAADVNGDGEMDALAANNDDFTARWYQNDGATPPSFTAREISNAGARGLDVADIDSDGDNDVAVASFPSNRLEWHESSGGAIPSWTAHPLSGLSGAHGVAAVDLDGDNDLDLTGTGFDSEAIWLENFGNTLPALAASDITIIEGDSGSQTWSFEFNLSHAATGDVTFDYATEPGTATSPDDYLHTAGTATITDGTTQVLVNVPIVGDVVDEAPFETFTLEIENVSPNVNVGDPSVTGTIQDNELPTLSVDDVSVTEGDTGSLDATFTLSLTSIATETVTVAYSTTEGTADDPSDFAGQAGNANIDQGTTSATVSVPVNGDLHHEADETFTLGISAPNFIQNCFCEVAVDGDTTGVGTITNDDTVTLTINDPAPSEGDDAGFVVSSSKAISSDVTVTGNTANGTAGSSDYTAAASQTFTIPAGSTTSNTVNVATTEDTIDEPNETFTMGLSNASSNATLGETSGTATITDDDGTPTLTINDPTVTEGGTAGFTVTASNPSSTAITVTGNTANGTASGNFGADFTGVSDQTFTIPAESITSNTINISTTDDDVDEDDETFKMLLSDPSANATLAELEGVATITDNDDAPVITVNDVSGTEDDFGSGNYTFALSANRTKSTSFSVKVATADGTATAPDDYTAVDTTVTWAPGEQFKTVSIPMIVADDIDEANETFTLNLSDPSGATIGDDQGVGTIEDDDDAPALSVDDPSVTEGPAAGTSTLTFTVSATNAKSSNFSVQVDTADGTAETADYDANSDVLMFTPGQTSRTFDVVVNGDNIHEANETVLLNLTSPSGATIADGQGVGTINDDDAAPTLSFLAAEVKSKEGKKGTTKLFTFTVNKTGPTEQTATVDFATVPGSAKAPKDYVHTAGSLSFAPGETTKSIDVTVNGDRKVEKTEKFTVLLSNPQNASITGTNPAVGKIKNDDR